MATKSSKGPQDSESSRKGKIGALLLAAAAVVAILVLLFMDDKEPSKKGAPRAAVAAAAQPEGAGDQANAPQAAPNHYALHRDEEQVKAIEAKMAPLTARFEDDPKATPCERAFSGFEAFLEADVEKHNTTFVLPEKKVFLARCTTALTDQEQLCLSASYQAKHRDICEPIYRGLSEKVFERMPGDPIH